MSDRVHATAFDILHLIEVQRGRVQALLDSAQRRVEQVQELAARARLVRYEAFLRYLDDLAALYSKELGVVDIAAFRNVMTGNAMTGRAG